MSELFGVLQAAVHAEVLQLLRGGERHRSDARGLF